MPEVATWESCKRPPLVGDALQPSTADGSREHFDAAGIRADQVDDDVDRPLR